MARIGQEVSDHELLKYYPILVHFEIEHLPEDLQVVSRPFRDLAWTMARKIPYNGESKMFLRKLLEAKDCAVRAAVGG